MQRLQCTDCGLANSFLLYAVCSTIGPLYILHINQACKVCLDKSVVCSTALPDGVDYSGDRFLGADEDQRVRLCK